MCKSSCTKNSCFMQPPNWLACASCQAPLVHRDELEPQIVTPVLKDAVYTYTLEMLGREVPVYSATNGDNDRFDLVRASLSENTPLPIFDEQHNFVDHRDIEWLRNLYRRINEMGDAQDAQEALLEMEMYEDENHSETTDSSCDIESPNVLCSRVRARSHEPVEEYSWFPPFPWTVADCANCSQQIGWAFWADPPFCALIVTRLREKHY